MDKRVKLVNPKNSKIIDVQILERVIHFDPRGFLVETMRKDDKKVGGDKFVMSYNSMTPPGVARDETQWHHHKKQVDRFICVKGRIALALCDNRKNSKTYGVLQVLDLEGAQSAEIKKREKKERITYMVTVPEGVYHCYKNIGDEDCLLVNFPTQLYNSNDEGRTLFKDIPIDSLSNRTFSWNLLEY